MPCTPAGPFTYALTEYAIFACWLSSASQIVPWGFASFGISICKTFVPYGAVASVIIVLVDWKYDPQPVVSFTANTGFNTKFLLVETFSLIVKFEVASENDDTVIVPLASIPFFTLKFLSLILVHISP